MQKDRALLRYILFFINLGSSMYGLFTPIYFLNQGVPYGRVILTLIFWCLGGAASGMLAGIFIRHLGVKSFIVLRGLLEPLTIMMLNLYPLLKYPPEIQGFISGFVVLSFWVSMDILTAVSTDSANRGKQQSSIYSGMIIAGIVAPFIGGFIISRLGYSFLFTISLLLILVGGILSFFIRNEMKPSGKIRLLPDVFGKYRSHMMLSMLRGGTFSMAAWLFPLIIFKSTASEILLGSLGTVFSIVALAANLAAGHLFDRHSKKSTYLMYFGSAITWAIAGFISGEILIYLMAAITFFYNMVNIAINSLFFNAAGISEIPALVSERVIAFSLGGAFLLLLHYFIPYNGLFFACSSLVIISFPFIKEASI